ncbi:MAG: hypothetical protein Q9167_004011 [Letrouitia subvulpina]
MNQLAGSKNDYGAVGSPDVLPPQGLIFDDGEHCDNADFLDFEFAPNYPQSREKATAALQKCLNHMKKEIAGGVRSAKALLNSHGQISTIETSSDLIDCQFRPSSDILNQFLGRAKCNVLQGFGYALHGVQDFYSHSNYGDSRNDKEAISILNPPGLGNKEKASFLDLRTWTGLPLNKFISRWLSTGCFNLVELVHGESGVLGCNGRITHATLNKDEGDITEAGKTSNPKTPRGKKGNNFDSAVRLAIEDTRRQWKDFQDRLRSEYGATKANLMICAITKDDPKNSCQGRYLAIAVDSSGSNSYTDPKNLRISAAQSFVSKLVPKKDVSDDGLPDLVTVIDFDSSARVVYPLGDPSQASFAGIDSSGDTDIASGISASIDELSSKASGKLKDHAGILVLTDGDDPNPAAVKAQLSRAQGLGIRVNWGFLSPTTISYTGVFPRSHGSHGEPIHSRRLTKRAPAVDLLSLILGTGGIYSSIDSDEAQKNFVDLVLSNGPTNIDNAGGAGTEIMPGLTIAKLISSSAGQVRFVYKAVSGESLNFTITSLSSQVLNATLHDIRNLEDLESKVTDSQGIAMISLRAASDIELELLVTAPNAQEEGVFTVGLSSSAPISNGANTTASSTVAVSSTLAISSTPVASTSNTVLPNATITDNASSSTPPSSTIEYPSSTTSHPINGTATSHGYSNATAASSGASYNSQDVDSTTVIVSAGHTFVATTQSLSVILLTTTSTLPCHQCQYSTPTPPPSPATAAISQENGFTNPIAVALSEECLSCAASSPSSANEYPVQGPSHGTPISATNAILSSQLPVPPNPQISQGAAIPASELPVGPGTPASSLNVGNGPGTGPSTPPTFPAAVPFPPAAVPTAGYGSPGLNSSGVAAPSTLGSDVGSHGGNVSTAGITPFTGSAPAALGYGFALKACAAFVLGAASLGLLGA